jgi:thiosulfate reductase cytochrome b subunit
MLLSKETHPMKLRFSLRTTVRWIHVIVAIPIYGYIYAPFDKVPLYAHPTRYVFFPIMVLTGLWMWKGHVVMRRFTKRPALRT